MSAGVEDLTREIFDFAPELFEIPLEEKMRFEVDRFGDVKIGGRVGDLFLLSFF